MKTVLFFALLAFHYELGTNAEESKLDDKPSSIQTRKLQLGTQELTVKKRMLTYVPTNACSPVKKDDIGFKREGIQSTYIYPSTLIACRTYCTFQQRRCVAFNFNNVTAVCTLLSSVHKFVAAKDTVTSLIRFEGGDPCVDAYIIREFHRSGSDYKIFKRGEVLSPEDCCRKCVADKPVGCVAWDYQGVSRRCYLKKSIPPIHSVNRPMFLYTGYGCGPT